jgi:hypothetical protein
MELPIGTKSNTDSEDPMRVSPYVEKLELRRAKLRAENELPMLKKSSTDKELPSREKP